MPDIDLFFQSSSVQSSPERPDAAWLRTTATGAVGVEALGRQALVRRAHALAMGLGTLGPLTGERVLILADNGPEWVITDFACYLSGAISVPLFPNVGLGTLGRVLAESQARYVVAANPWQAHKVLEVTRHVEGPLQVVVMHPTMAMPSGEVANLAELGPQGQQIHEFSQLEATGAARLEAGESAPWQEQAPSPEAVWSIVYTPGTAAEPKGVIWTRAGLAAFIEAAPYALFSQALAQTKDPTLLLTQSLAHAFTRIIMWMTWCWDLADPHRPALALARSEQRAFDDALLLRPTIIAGAPSVFERARDAVLQELSGPNVFKNMIGRWRHAVRSDEPTLGERLRDSITSRYIRRALKRKWGGQPALFLSGGARLGEGLQRFYLDNGLSMRASYGTVEAMALTHVDQAPTPDIGCVGTPLPGLTTRIADDGELLLKGPQLSPGTWVAPSLPPAPLTESGWLATADLAKYCSEGALRITDRKDAIMVLSNGRVVAPSPIEAALCEEPLIAQALVYGDGRDFLSALVALDPLALRAFAETEEIGPLDDDEALCRHTKVHARIDAHIEALNRRLPSHLGIRKHAILVEDLAEADEMLTPTHLLKRRHALTHYRALLDSFYAETF